jgi:hypothetical protein
VVGRDSEIEKEKAVSKVVGFVVGTAMIIAGVVLLGTPGGQVLGTSLIIQGSVMIVTQAVVDLTMPKTPARQASEMSIALGEQPRAALFGETFTPGSLVDGFNYGGKYGTDWECLVIRLADHKCEGLTGFYVDDTFVPYVGNGVYPEFDTHHFELYFRADTTAEALPTVVTSHAPGWTSADIGASGCDVVVCYLADAPDAKHPAWPGGRPRFGFVVKGKLCYDPRLDDSVGGSGAHRWDDPATWEFSENPAVCRYNWARGIYANDVVSDPSQLLIGRGLSAAEAPPANIFAPANLCDEVVDSGVRYRVAGPIYANQEHIDVEEMFALCCGGSVVTREGSVELEPGQSKSIVAVITDDDLLTASRVSYNHGVLSEASAEWVNTIVANYVEPAQQWADHAAPVVRSTADILADGKPREAQIALRLVKDQNQALRIAEINRRLGRLWARASFTLGPRHIELEDGDWINWQSDLYLGGGTKTFRIEAYSIDEKWQNTLTLREINADVFDGVTAFSDDNSVVTPTTPPIDIGAPTGANWALAAVTLANGGVSVPALEITGSASDDASVQTIIIEYWKSDGVINPLTNPDDPAWIMEGPHPPSTTKVDITSIQGGQPYYAAVTYVVSGIYGDRLVLGPVTPGSIDVTGQVQPLIDAATGKLAWKQPVRAKTAAALAANTYANGSSGVGATLTGNANGALAAVDGVTLVANDRVLVDQEATGSHNGIYKLTQVGDGSHPYILTRVTDADEAAELVNAAVKISEGSTFADQEWQCTTNAAVTVGTTALVWAQAGGLITVKDEGVTLTGVPTVINFTGPGVSATNVGGVVTVNVPGGDPSPSAQFANVVLLAGFNGADAATSYTEESSYTRAATFAGNAQLDTGIAPAFGTAALLLDGTGDYLSFPTSTALSVANGDDQTIEGFFRITSVATTRCIISKRTSGEFGLYVVGGKLNLSVFNGTTQIAVIAGTTAIAINTWYYFAIVRRVGKWTAFLGTPGGTAVIEGTDEEASQPSGNTQALLIGRDAFDTTRDFPGSIDEVRWTRRQALYSAAFPVPSSAFPRS